MFKLQVQDDEECSENWRDVKNEQGQPLVFATETEARSKLEELFPVLVKLELFAAGPKRTRVIVMNAFQDVDEPDESRYR